MKPSSSANATQMVAVRIPHEAPSKPLYDTRPFMTEYLLSIDEAAKLLADLQVAVMNA